MTDPELVSQEAALVNRPGHEGINRIRLIDALRGLSLAGIVMVHFGEQYLGFMPPAGQPYNVQGTLDGVLEALSWVFIRGKGFGIFSFMFGLSFVLQMQRAERRRPGTDFRPRFAWRLLVLFAIGWLHGFAYSGDILTVYAALGIPLILFYRVRDRWLLVLAVLLLVGVPRIAQRVVQGPSTPAQRQSLQSRMNADAEEHWRALAAMKHCRTQSSLKMQVKCTECEHQTRVPHSCGHRHCPHCQHHESQQWLERQMKKQVPAEYFMMTFTLPAEFSALAWAHQ